MIDLRRNEATPLGACAYGSSTKGQVLGSVGQVFLGPLAGALGAAVSKKDRWDTVIYGLGPAGALGAALYKKKQGTDSMGGKGDSPEAARQRALVARQTAPRPSGDY